MARRCLWCRFGCICFLLALSWSAGGFFWFFFGRCCWSVVRSRGWLCKLIFRNHRFGLSFPTGIYSFMKPLHLNVYDLLYPSAKLWSVTQVSPVQHSMMLDLQYAQASWPCTTIVCNGAAQRGQRWILALIGCAWLSTISLTNWKNAGEASLARTKPISQISRS